VDRYAPATEVVDSKPTHVDFVRVCALVLRHDAGENERLPVESLCMIGGLGFARRQTKRT